MATTEEQVIEQYFDAFNRHDLEAVMKCFHEHIRLVDTEDKSIDGLGAVRERYAEDFATIPDAHCELRLVTGNSEQGVAESIFTGTIKDIGAVRAVGTEVMLFADGKIKEIRDYHRLVKV